MKYVVKKFTNSNQSKSRDLGNFASTILQNIPIRQTRVWHLVSLNPSYMSPYNTYSLFSILSSWSA